jgi:hypothetical protein
MKTRRPLLLPVVMLIATAVSGRGQAADSTTTSPVRDKYAQVDVERTMRALHILGGDNKAERKKLMDEIQKNSANYAPPTFFSRGEALWQDGRSDS